MKLAQRVASIAIVIAAGIAVASSGDGQFTAMPPVNVIPVMGSGGATAITGLLNGSSAAVMVGSITLDPTCDPGVIEAPSGPFTVLMNMPKPLTLTCPAGALTGMRRCLFHVLDPASTPLLDFEAVCEYASMPTLQPDMTSLNFGSVAVGNTSTITVHLTNNSPTQIHELFFETTDLDNNFLIGTPCNPDGRECNATIAQVNMGGTTSFDVSCSPQTVGAHMASLFIATDTDQKLTTTIPLLCSGTASSNPVISVMPTSVAVGNVEVIGATGTGDIAIHNAGGGTLQISDIRIVDSGNGAALDWTSTPSNACTTNVCGLAGAAELDLHIVFDPSAIGVRDATLVISYHDTVDRTMSVPLQGTGLGATLTLVGGNTMIDFGLVPINVASTITFQLANNGNRDLTDAVLTVMPSGPPFSLSPANPVTVTHTAQTTITATCKPTAAGMFTTTFGASAPDTFMSAPISIMAKCEGSTQTLFSNPTTISLGEVRTGTPTLHVPVMALGASLSITDVHFDTPNPPNLTLSFPTLPAPTTLAIDLGVAPATEGDLANKIDITAGNGDSIHIPITGKVVTAAFFVPAVFPLGTFCVSQSTTATTVALMSTGTATLQLQAPVMETTSSPFQLQLTSPSTYPSALAPGASAVVEVTPQPQSVAGTLLDNLVWTTDVTGMEMPKTMLSAVFVDNGGAIAPSAIGFGKVAVSHVDRPNGQRVTLQNCGTTALQLSSQIDSPFKIEGASVPTALQPNESATISVGFHPQTVGSYSGKLTITVTGGDALTVMLSGEGVIATTDGDAGITDGGGSKTSFYACGCRTFAPGGGAPIAFAVIWLVSRPRRRRLPLP